MVQRGRRQQGELVDGARVVPGSWRDRRTGGSMFVARYIQRDLTRLEDPGLLRGEGHDRGARYRLLNGNDDRQ